MTINDIVLHSMPYTEMTSRDTCISEYTTKARQIRHPFSVVLPWSHSIKLQSVSITVLSELQKRKWYLLIDIYRNYSFDCFYLEHCTISGNNKSIHVWINPSSCFFFYFCCMMFIDITLFIIRIAKLTFSLTFCE